MRGSWRWVGVWWRLMGGGAVSVVAGGGRFGGVGGVGRGVVTPEGRGVVCGVERPGWGSTGPAVVIVGFGFPVVEERQRGRKVERVTFLFEVERRYPVGDVELVLAAAQRAAGEAFMARTRDPCWRPAALPRSRRLPRMPEAKFEALMREHGADRVS